MPGLDTDFTMEQQAQRVLLIEHDESFARDVTAMLEQASDTVSSVTVVSSLEEGLARLSAEHFGIVLLEFFLPDGAGLLNIPVLKQQSPLVPVIVIGAVDEEAIAVESVHAGAQDYLARGVLSTRMLARSIRYTRERQEADVALLAAEEKYRGIFDHLMEGIFQTTPEGHYLMANAALARIYGYASPEELKLSLTDIGGRLYVHEKNNRSLGLAHQLNLSDRTHSSYFHFYLTARQNLPPPRLISACPVVRGERENRQSLFTLSDPYSRIFHTQRRLFPKS